MKKIIKHKSKGQTKRHTPSAQPIKENNHHLGMTLYKNKQYLEALLTWWPSIKKQPDDIYQKCLEIAQLLEKNIPSVLKHDKLQSSEHLNTCYLVFKYLMPSSSLCIHIERALLKTWWQEKNFNALEHHVKTELKNEHDTNVHRHIENLGKLAFSEANKKYKNSIPAFIGSVLTGASSLILNTRAYQPELEASLQALGQELHHVIIQHQHRLKQKYVWDADMLSYWIDYEVAILTLVLKQAIADPAHAPEIMPTPSYFTQSSRAQTSSGKHFLTWLEAQNNALVTLYDTQVQDAVLWVLGGEKISEITDCLASENYPSWDPYLQLAIALRAEALKPGSMDEFFIHSHAPLPEIETLPPLKMLALRAAHAILDANIAKHDSRQQRILAKLIELMPNMQDPRLKHMKHCVQRQHDCIVLLDQLAEDKSKKIIASLKTHDQLRDHLTLIADTAKLIPYNETNADGIDLYWHVEKLLKSKRIQSLIPFKEYFTNHGRCCCESCIEFMLEEEISTMTYLLNLPVVNLKSRPVHPSSIPPEESKPVFQSILSQADPFKTLGASVHDSKQAIMKKVMICIQQSPENMATFRHAQQALFNLPQRFLYHYLCHLNLPNVPESEQVIYDRADVV